MKNKSIKLILIGILITIIIIPIEQTYSMYISNFYSQTDIIAKAILTLDNDSMTYSIKNMLPGDTKEYEFSVSNYDSVNTNEVLMKYYIEIVTTSTNSPINVEILDMSSGEEMQLTDNKTSEIELNYGEKVINNYKLVLTWDESKNSADYANLSLQYNIKLVATQVVE